MFRPIERSGKRQQRSSHTAVKRNGAAHSFKGRRKPHALIRHVRKDLLIKCFEQLQRAGKRVCKSLRPLPFLQRNALAPHSAQQRIGAIVLFVFDRADQLLRKRLFLTPCAVKYATTKRYHGIFSFLFHISTRPTLRFMA